MSVFSTCSWLIASLLSSKYDFLTLYERVVIGNKLYFFYKFEIESDILFYSKILPKQSSKYRIQITDHR